MTSYPSTPSTAQCGTTPCNSSLFQYHTPPVGVDYTQNPSVFGRILEGTLPSTPYAESVELYAFRDIKPRARLHALVIPKRFVPTVKCVLATCSCCPTTANEFTRSNRFQSRNGVDASSETETNTKLGESISSRLSLILDIKQMALSILQTEEPEAYEKGDYILCFHVPPFNSVDHLHLHVLCPASQMNFAYRYGKYLTGTAWCLDLDELIHRLENQVKEKSSLCCETTE